MKRFYYFSLVISALLFVSCRKDNHNSDNTGETFGAKVDLKSS